MNEAFIYMWVDITTGKRYIGCHKGDILDGYVCSSKPMMRDYNQRPQDFQRTLIDTGTWKEMLTREQNLIIEHNAVKDPMFYNQADSFGPYHCLGAMKGRKHSEESKIRMSVARKGCSLPPQSKETRLKKSAAMMGNKNRLGHTHTEESRAKMAVSQTGNKNCVGYIHTEEARTNMSIARKGKPRGTYKKKVK
jgi:NUMOD3 motif